jgi:hypothetical protein
MSIEQNFHHAEQDSLNQKYDSGMERKILKFWREYEPKKVQRLLDAGSLRQTLKLTAKALFEMQLALEECERLDPTLAAMEAWNRLMKIEEEEDEILDEEVLQHMRNVQEYGEFLQGRW